VSKSIVRFFLDRGVLKLSLTDLAIEIALRQFIKVYALPPIDRKAGART
jgi:hypothetical protein